MGNTKTRKKYIKNPNTINFQQGYIKLKYYPIY